MTAAGLRDWREAPTHTLNPALVRAAGWTIVSWITVFWRLG